MAMTEREYVLHELEELQLELVDFEHRAIFLHEKLAEANACVQQASHEAHRDYWQEKLDSLHDQIAELETMMRATRKDIDELSRSGNS